MRHVILLFVVTLAGCVGHVVPKGEATVNPQLHNESKLTLSKPEVIYPQSARRNGEEGRVTIIALVDEYGAVKSMQVEKSSGYISLDEAAKEAVTKSKFKPYIENGRPTAVYIKFPFNFELSEDRATLTHTPEVRPLGSVMKLEGKYENTVGQSGDTMAGSSLSAYQQKLANLVKKNIVFDPSTVVGNPAVHVEVMLFPTGELMDAKIIQGSGYSSWDNAVLRALKRTAVLPLFNTDPRYRKMVWIFRPKE